MEESPPSSQQERSANSEAEPALKKTKALLIVGVIIMLLFFGAGIFLRKDSRNTKNISKSLTPLPSEKSINHSNSFFYFKIPRPLEDLGLEDLPNTAYPHTIVKHNDHVWFAGVGSIIEYDRDSEKLISYSNAKQANCRGDLVLINNYIYAACHIDNIEDAFGTVRKLTTRLYTGHFGILKINPDTHQIEHTFSKQDGLLNGYNYELYADGDDIWIATFDGVGRINSKTNNVDFYKQELGFPDVNKNYSVRHMFVDRDYVWVFFVSNAEAQGGVALYNKKLNTWKAFGPRELQENPRQFDLDSNNGGPMAKLIAGGIQIAFRDGKIGEHDRLVEKQFNYETGIWTKIAEHIATGEESEKTYKILEPVYPPPSQDYLVDSDGLTQITLRGTDRTFQLDGRSNVILSPVINNKRYILTNSTIDVIDEDAPFRQILVKLGESLFGDVQYMDPFEQGTHVQFLIDHESLLALVINPSCEGMGCDGKQKVWLVDLKSGKINKIYTADSGGLPIGDKLTGKMKIHKSGDFLILTKESEEEVFKINILNNDLVVPKS